MANNVNVSINASAINELKQNIDIVKRTTLERLANRGFELLQEEAPDKTGNLKKGIAKPEIDYVNLTATINVSARSVNTSSRKATLYGVDGTARKQVTLRGRKPFDYGLAVTEGREAQIAPKGKAFLIPVSSVNTGESYIDDGKQKFIARTKIRAVAANPFDKRAANRLSDESENIAESTIKDFF